MTDIEVMKPPLPKWGVGAFFCPNPDEPEGRRFRRNNVAEKRIKRGDGIGKGGRRFTKD